MADIFEKIASDIGKRKLESAIANSIGSDPDRFSRTYIASERTGLPIDVVDRNFDEVAKSLEPQIDVNDIHKNYPGVAKFMSDDNNAKISRDDVENLKRTELHLSPRMSDYGKSIMAGAASFGATSLSGLGETAMIAKRTYDRYMENVQKPFSAATDYAASKLGIGNYNPESYVDNWGTSENNTFDFASTLFRIASKDLKGRIEGIRPIQERRNIGTDIAEGVGQVGGQIASYALAPEIGVPSLFSQGVDMVSDAVKEKGKYGTVEGDAASLLGGGITALTEKFGLDILIGKTPKIVQSAVINNVIKYATKIGIDVNSKALAYTGKVALGAASEASQEFTEGILQNITEKILIDPKTPLIEGLDRQAIEAGGTGAIVKAIIEAMTPGRYRVHNRNINGPADAENYINQMHQMARESKLLQRNQDKYRDFIKDISGDERLYIDPDAALNVIDTLDAEGRDILFKRMPELQTELQQASIAGTEISIPKSDYMAYIAPYPQADSLSKYIRLDPNDYTIAEREDLQNFIASNPDIEKKFSDIVNAAPSIDTKDAEIAIKRVFRQGLVNSGRSLEEAKNVGELTSKFITRLATPFNKQGTDVLNNMFVQFQSVTKDGKVIKSGSNYDILLKDLEKLQSNKLFKGLNKESKRAAEEFGQKLQQAGITVEQAKGMSSTELFDKVNPVQSEVGGDVLNQIPHDDVKTAYISNINRALQDKSKYSTINIPAGDLSAFGVKGNLVLDTRVLLKATELKHNVSLDTIKAIPDLIKDPEQVIRTSDSSQSIIFKLNAKDLSGRDIIAVVSADKTGANRSFIKSIYGKNNNNWFKKQEENGLVVYKKAGFGTPSPNDRTKTSFKSILTLNKGKVKLDQQERGSIQFTRDMAGRLRKSVISFTSQANLSTAAHEFSHFAVALHRQFAVEAMNEIERGNNDPEIIRISDDWEALKKAVGAESDDFTVEQEEQVAGWFEQYLRNGEAPSDGLRAVFARFREWFTRIYKDIVGLGVEINPEVRGIFDRWLASESEINQARGKNAAIEEIAKNLGFNESITSRISDYIAAAKNVGETKLYKELTREQRRRETKKYYDEFTALRKKVSEEIKQKQNYKAIQALKESGQKVYLGVYSDPVRLGNPDIEFSPEDAVIPNKEDLEKFISDQMDAESAKSFAIDVLLSKEKKPSKPKSLTSFIISRGGIRTEGNNQLSFLGDKTTRGDGGELKYSGIENKTKRGIVNNKRGLELDYAREAAVEAGYISESSDISDFLNALREDFNGNEIYSAADQDMALSWGAYQQAIAEADRITNELNIDIELEKQKRRKLGRYADLFADDPATYKAVNSDEIAEYFGYSTGKELINAIIRSPDIDRVIDRETRSRMFEKYPDMIESGRIKQEAGDAIANDKVLLALDLMIKELGKGKGNTASMRQYAKVIAEKRLAEIKIGEVGYSYRYDVARDKEMRSALQASRSGESEKALFHLQRAMISQALYAGIKDFEKTYNKSEELFRKIRSKDKDLAKTYDMDFIGAARYVLHKFGMSGQTFDINTWLADMAERDPDVVIDLASLQNIITTPDKPYKELSIDEYKEIYNSITNILWMARKNKEFEIGERKVKDAEAVAALVETIGKQGTGRQLEGTQVYGIINRGRSGLLALRATTRRMEHWVDSIDGGYGGNFREYIWNPVSKAANEYRNARHEWHGGLNNILQKHKDYLTQLGKISFPEIIMNGRPWIARDRLEVIGFLLHTGNSSNLDKLLGGYGISLDSYKSGIDAAMKDGRLTKQDFDIVQELWNFAEDLKPLAQRAHRKLYGYRFEEITPVPIETTWGSYRGGYWPAIVDYEQVDSKNIERAIAESKQFMIASAGKGFTKSRVAGYKKPLSTDLRLAMSHVDQVLRFSYMEPVVRQVSRLINNESFKDAIKSIDSEAYAGLLMPWLQRSVDQITSKPLRSKPANMLGKLFRTLRVNTSAQAMMFNLSNAIQNFTSIPISMHKVGVRNFAKSMAVFLSNPKSAIENVRNLSDMMKYRQTIFDHHIESEINEIIGRGNIFGKVKDAAIKHGYIFQQITQNTIDAITWMAAYNQHIADGHTNEEAIKYADSSVRETQSSGNPEDISDIEASNNIAKPFMMFYMYFNNIANYAITDARVIMKEHGWKGAPKLFYLYVMVGLLPSVLGDIVSKALRDDLPDDKDEDGEVLDEWLSFIGMSQAKYLLASVPLAGQFGNYMINAANDNPMDDRITVSPVVNQIESLGKTVKNIFSDKDVDDSKLVRDSLNALGFITGMPLGQLSKPASYIADVNEGESNPEDMASWARGLVGGPSPKK